MARGGEWRRLRPRRESRVERLGSEDRGAENAEGCGLCVPIPTGEGFGEETVLHPQKLFRLLSSNRRVLVHSGTDKTYF